MENIRAAMNRGAFDFVTKPIDFEDLELTLKRTMRPATMMHCVPLHLPLQERCIKTQLSTSDPE